MASRESRLAMWQANHIKERLEQNGYEIEINGMTTEGDQRLDVTLNEIGGKGLFIKELEQALLNGSADLAVHSMKDVPMDLADASLVAMAEVLNQKQIFTLDSDFYIYRRYGNQPFEVVP